MKGDCVWIFILGLEGARIRGVGACKEGAVFFDTLCGPFKVLAGNRAVCIKAAYQTGVNVAVLKIVIAGWSRLGRALWAPEVKEDSS